MKLRHFHSDCFFYSSTAYRSERPPLYNRSCSEFQISILLDTIDWNVKNPSLAENFIPLSRFSSIRARSDQKVHFLPNSHDRKINFRFQVHSHAKIWKSTFSHQTSPPEPISNNLSAFWAGSVQLPEPPCSHFQISLRGNTFTQTENNPLFCVTICTHSRFRSNLANFYHKTYTASGTLICRIPNCYSNSDTLTQNVKTRHFSGNFILWIGIHQHKRLSIRKYTASRTFMSRVPDIDFKR